MFEKRINILGDNYHKRNLILSVLFLIFIFSIAFFNLANAEEQNMIVLSVYDSGARTSFKTNAKTVGEALERKEILISSADKVEPSLEESLIATDYSVNIYRARPILIEDGVVRERVMSSGQTTAAIAKDAGLAIYDEDIISIINSQNTAEDGVATRLVVDRAKLINVNLFGKQTIFRTQGQTIADFINEKNIKLNQDDAVSLALDTQLINGSEFSIWRNGKQTITVDEEIDFNIEEIRDADKDVGYKEIKELGVKGSKTVTYEVEMRNGEELKRNLMTEVIKTKAKKQIEIVGTKAKALPAGSHEDWMSTAGISPSDYGYVNYIFHRESTWRPAARNPNGLYVGLGQTSQTNLSRSCPNWEADPVCQIQFFNGYAINRYGSWAEAYNFWIKKHWW